MFTGIIEELGTVQQIIEKGNTLLLGIGCKKILEDVKLGDSIAVNGVCLTVTEFDNRAFYADVMPETFKSTSLSQLKTGSKVNLERAMSAIGRFGGHFVSGHVDGTGTILKREPKENAIYIQFSIPEEFQHFALLKGSIAVDGTSLTIFHKTADTVTVSIIPHTAKETVLGMKKPGDLVNIEFDMIGKYLFSFFQRKEEQSKSNGNITMDFLKENGFL